MNWSRIPGSFRFLSSLLEDATSGISGTLVLPEIVETRSVLEAMSEIRDQKFPGNQIIPVEAGVDFDHEERPTLALLDVLEKSGVMDELDSPQPSDIAKALGGATLVAHGFEGMSSDRQATWSQFLKRFGSLKLESSVSGGGAIVLVTRGKVIAYRPPQEPSIGRWDWRGVLSVEDIYAHLRFDAEESQESLCVYQATEICGGDIELAERLVSIAPVDLPSIGKVLRERKIELGIEDYEPFDSEVTDREWDGAFLRGWRQEVSSLTLDHPSVLVASDGSNLQGPGEAELKHRLWLSQVRSILPRLEMWRADLADHAIQLGILPDDDELDIDEFGDLRQQLRESLLGPPELRSRLEGFADDLRVARNRIAHHGFITAKRWRELKASAGGLLPS